jgi:hypothetical protein
MSEPLDIDPQNPEPQNGGPQIIEPQNSEPRNSGPGNSEPGAWPAADPTPATSANAATTLTAPAPSGDLRRHRRGLRVRTLVFGLLLGLISTTVLVSEVTGDRVDGAAIAIVALIGAGVILLAGAVGAAGRAEA